LSDGFFNNLAQGNYGLAKTFWLYGVCADVVFNLFIILVNIPEIILIALFIYVFYKIQVIIGIMESASKYLGPSAWAILAKGFSISSLLSLFFSLLSLIIPITDLIKNF